MNRKLTSAVGLVLVLVLFLSLNIAGKALGAARVDLTEDKLYTLSDGARRILEGLDREEPIQLRFYFSEKVADELPGPLAGQYDAYAKRVRDTLLEFERRAQGGLALEELDPEPYSETEDRAVQYGLQGLRNPATGDRMYFGLAASNSVGDEEVIPLFQEEKERFLEYDLARLIHALAHTERPVLGVLSTLPIEGAVPNPMNPTPPRPWYVADQLRQMFDVRTILPTAGVIPEDVSLLLVVHPKNLSDAMVYAIDQFVVKGGSAVLLVDPRSDYEEVPRDPQNPMQSLFADRSSNLGRLFEAWGIEMVPDKIVVDVLNAPFSQTIIDPKTQREERLRNILILKMLKYQTEDGQEGWSLSQDEVSTSQLQSGVNVRTAGALRPLPGSAIEFVPLMETSPESMLIDKSTIQFQADLRALIADFFPSNENYAIAARLRGPVASAFPDGPPAAEAGAAEGGHLASSSEPIDVIVVADVDWLHDSMWVQELGQLGPQRLVQMFADNGNFLVNALDNMSGSSDLISLRGRGGARRPFTKVEELERQAEQRYKTEENDLLERIDEAERRLAELQKEKDESTRFILSPEQEAEIDKLLDDQIGARTRLREVRHELRKDIENLGLKVKFANIGLIPIALIALAIGVSAVRRKRYQRS